MPDVMIIFKYWKITFFFAGEMVTFDNLRVLHGRTAFGENLKGERHVQGAYVDWVEARSKIRVLKASKSNQ